MPKWQYKIIDDTVAHPDFEGELNKLGALGWELFAIVPKAYAEGDSRSIGSHVAKGTDIHVAYLRCEIKPQSMPAARSGAPRK